MKYRERNEVQRWLYRRELEKLAPASVYYLDECGVAHRLYRESGRAPRGERIYEAVAGKRRARTSVIAACQPGKLVAPLTFAGTCNTAVVDAYFAHVLLPVLPAGSVLVLDNARFHQSPTTAALVVGRAARCSSCPPTHRTSIPWNTFGPPVRASSAKTSRRRQPRPFYRQYMPILLLIAIVTA